MGGASTLSSQLFRLNCAGASVRPVSQLKMLVWRVIRVKALEPCGLFHIRHFTGSVLFLFFDTVFFSFCRFTAEKTLCILECENFKFFVYLWVSIDINVAAKSNLCDSFLNLKLRETEREREGERGWCEMQSAKMTWQLVRSPQRKNVSNEMEQYPSHPPPPLSLSLSGWMRE